MRVRAIVNPKSNHGRTAAAWPLLQDRLEAALGPVEPVFTAAPREATTFTRQALEAGTDLVIAVGGDGTINEVVNGFFAGPTSSDNVPLRPTATLALLTSGTGGDFRKTFNLSEDLGQQVHTIAAGHDRAIDIGRVDFLDHDGQPAVRYFANIASFGLSGLVSGRVNQAGFSKRLSGRMTYFLASLRSLVGYKPSRVVITVDGQPGRELGIITAAVCNGRYFGGGMHMAPQARPDDGAFDIVVMHDMTLPELLRDPNAIYHGTHLDHPKVLSLHGQRVVATPVALATPVAGPPVLLDIDGETPGRLPATFTILPASLKLRCPP